MAIDRSKLTRAINPMPAEVKQALTSNDLIAAYEARPAYQQNDYLGWIARAKRADTRQKRIDQMISELKAGDSYMNMKWRPG